MKKITEKKKHRSRVRFRVLLAAATIALLAITAVAAENLRTSQWFQDVLNQELQKDREYVAENEMGYTVQETVSQEQMDILDRLGEGFQPQTVTSGGAAMTLTAGYGDESVLHLYLQVTAPEGTVLPDGIQYALYSRSDTKFNEDHKPIWLPVLAKEGAPYDTVYGQNIEVEPLPDENPTDNKKDFHIRLTCQSPFSLSYLGSSKDKVLPAFNDGIGKTFNSTGLYRQVPDAGEDEDEDTFEPIFTGDFCFDITYTSNPEKKVLDVTGWEYSGHTVRQWTYEGEEISREWDYTVTPIYFAITPMSVNWVNDFTCTNEWVSMGLEFKVVMKDGTSPVGSFGDSASGNTQSVGTTIFNNPIDFSQVDYILIGNPEGGVTHKVYLPSS